MSKKTIREIKTALPGIESEKVDVLADELDNILALKELFTSDGGKVLINRLRDNCSVALRKAIVAAKSGDTDKLIPFILDYSANINLLSSIQDISMEKEIREQLDEAVKEAYRT